MAQRDLEENNVSSEQFSLYGEEKKKKKQRGLFTVIFANQLVTVLAN